MEDSTITVLAENVDLATEIPWTQQDEEPGMWFQRFVRYFLPLGPGRSLYGAYQLMMESEFPSVAKARKEKYKDNPGAKPQQITSWGKQARIWKWHERSKAFDRFTYKAAQAMVDQARITLLGSAEKAAQALVGALTNPRLQVAAAKEILDRAGLPGTTNVGLGPIEKFTADEFRLAEQDLEEWEQQTVISKPTLE